MYKTIKNGFLIAGVLVIVVLSLGLPSMAERTVLGGGAVIVFIVIVSLGGEYIRRFLEGYYTYMSGNAEEGELDYKDGKNTIRLYFRRRPRVIYVPTNVKWVELMPDWAKEEKKFIMDRIKAQVGKHWNFQETEDEEQILAQK